MFTRGDSRPRVTPMPIDYETVGAFYETLSKNLAAFVARVGEKEAFCGDRNLQISRKEIDFQGCDPVICSITALKAFDAIVSQGEGASTENADSHYCRFLEIREELRALRAANPDFQPAHPAAVNPVLRRPVRAGARVWLENEETAATVDLANTAYMLMLRLIAHSYLVPRPHPAKALCVDLGLGLDARHVAARRARSASAGGAVESRIAMAACRSRRCATPRRCRRASVPESFSSSGCVNWRPARRRSPPTAMRAWRRHRESSTTCCSGPSAPSRTSSRIRRRGDCGAPRQRVAPRASRRSAGKRRAAVIEPGNVAPTPRTVDGVDYIEGRDLTLIYEGKKCIHSRFCVTLGTESIHRERERAVDQSRRDVHRGAHRDRACLRVGGDSLQAQRRPARRRRRRR